MQSRQLLGSQIKGFYSIRVINTAEWCLTQHSAMTKCRTG